MDRVSKKEGTEKKEERDLSLCLWTRRVFQCFITNIYIYMYIYIYIYKYIYIYTYISVYLYIYISIYLSIYLFIYLSIYLYLNDKGIKSSR